MGIRSTLSSCWKAAPTLNLAMGCVAVFLLLPMFSVHSYKGNAKHSFAFEFKPARGCLFRAIPAGDSSLSLVRVCGLCCRVRGVYIFKLQYSNTALIRAAVDGQAECVKVLLEAGANVEARNKVRS